jgi:hypothetical protein
VEWSYVEQRRRSYDTERGLQEWRKEGKERMQKATKRPGFYSLALSDEHVKKENCVGVAWRVGRNPRVTLSQPPEQTPSIENLIRHPPGVLSARRPSTRNLQVPDVAARCRRRVRILTIEHGTVVHDPSCEIRRSGRGCTPRRLVVR